MAARISKMRDAVRRLRGKPPVEQYIYRRGDEVFFQNIHHLITHMVTVRAMMGRQPVWLTGEVTGVGTGGLVIKNPNNDQEAHFAWDDIESVTLP